MKKVLVTGGSGFIGIHVVKSLQAQGYNVFMLERMKPSENQENTIQCDLLDNNQIQAAMESIKPEYLLHLAWDTTHNTYLHADSNLDFVTASLNLLKYFAQYGGRRALFCGTCFEYAHKGTPLKESDPIAPSTLYGAAKAGLHTIAEQYAKEHAISFVWTRLFYLFGENEKPTRVFPYIVGSLKQGIQITCRNASAVRDYLYVGDAAQAMVQTLISSVQGSVNICSGQALTMGEFFKTVAQAVGRPELVSYEDHPAEPEVVLGENGRLTREVGSIPQASIQDRIREIVK